MLSGALFFALYVAIGNAFLRFGGFGKLFESTRSVDADYAEAWTLWPGVVHVRGLRVFIEDHNVQSLIAIERATVHVSLHELPFKVFHATSVRGSGLSVRFRHKVMPESRDAPAVSALPEIPRFEDPPVFEATAPEAPVSDADYALWTIHLEDVDVRAKEVFVEQFQYVGPARAVGAFRLMPARHLWVGPARLLLGPGRVLAAGRDALRSFSGTIDCTVHPFDVRIPQGLEVFRNISARLSLHGNVVDGRAADLFLEPGTSVLVSGGGLGVDVGLDHGVLTPTSRVSFAALSASVAAPPRVVKFRGPVAVVGTAEEGGRARVSLRSTSATLNGPECGGISGAASGLSASADSTSRDAASEWALAGGAFAVRDATVSTRWDDVTVVAAGRMRFSVGLPVEGERPSLFLDAHARSVRLVAGKGPPERYRIDLPDAHVHSELHGAPLRGPITVDVARGEMTSGSVKMIGDLGARLQATANDRHGLGATLGGAVDVHDVDFRAGADRVAGWWGRVELPDLRVSAGRTVELDGTVRVAFRDGLPGLLALSAGEKVPGFVPDLFPLRKLHGTLKLHRRCSLLDVQVPEIEGGPLTLSGRIQNVPGDTRGALLVRFRDVGFLSAGIELGKEASGPSLFASDAWLGREEAELAAVEEWEDARSCGQPARSTCVN